MAARILDRPILTTPSYLLIEPLALGFYGRFEIWMYELAEAAQVGKSYPSEVSVGLLSSLMTTGIAVMVLGALYRVLLIAGFGATLGKMVMRIRVTRTDDSSTRTPGFVCALAWTPADELVGYFGAALLLLSTFVNYLMPLLIEKKQIPHDIMAGTIVIRN